MEPLLSMAAPPNPATEIARYVLSAAGVATLVGGMVWLVWIVRAVRRDLIRHRQGRCLHCGYDLRFCQGRCSECGSPIRQPLQPRQNP